MTRAEWTTKKQRKFLNKRIPPFLAIRESKSRAARATFFADTNKSWLKRWPMREPTEEEIEAKKAETQPRKGKKNKEEQQTLTTEEAKAAAYADICAPKFKQIKEWYQNHTREGYVTSKHEEAAARIAVNTGDTRPTRAVIKLSPKRILNRWQAHLELEGDSLRAEVTAKWDEHRQTAGKGSSNDWLCFLAKEVNKRVDQLDEAKLAELDEYRRAWNPYAQKDKTENDRNGRCLATMRKLPKTIEGATEAIQHQSGWSSIAIVGGPHPGEEGQLKVFISARGPSDQAKTFEEWLGPEKYAKLTQSFVDYLSEVYGGSEGLQKWVYTPEGDAEEEDVYLSDSDAENDTTRAPKSAPITVNTSDSDSDSESSSDEEEQSASKPARTKHARAKTHKTVAQLSEYEQQREERISANKAKMKEIFGTDSPSFFPKESNGDTKSRGGRSKGMKKKEVEEGNGDHERHLGGGGKEEKEDQSKTLPLSPEDTQDVIALDGAGLNDPVPTGDGGTAIDLSQASKLNSPPPPKDNNNSSPDPGNLGDAATASQSPHPEDDPDADGDTDDELRFKEQESQNRRQLAASTHTIPDQRSDILQPDQLQSNADNVDSKGRTDPDHTSGADDPNIKDTEEPGPSLGKDNTTEIGAKASHDSSDSHDGEDDNDQVEPGSKNNDVRDAEGVRNIEVMDIGESMTLSFVIESSPLLESHPDPPTPSPTPGMEGAWPVMTAASVDPRWLLLLNVFTAFEKHGPPSGKMTTAGRPSEVKDWIGSKKKAVVPDITTSDYGERWTGWWRILQLSWRKDAKGASQSRIVPDDADWIVLNKGGTSGLYTVVVSLAWWVGKVSDPNDRVWEVVADVEWVLTELGKLPAPVSKARAKRPMVQDSVVVDGPQKRSKTGKALNSGGV